MPAIKVTNQGDSDNALALLQNRTIIRPSLVSLYASCVTATDTLSFSVANKQIVVNANPNIEIAADVVDIDRDAILLREPVPMGEMQLAVNVTTAMNFLIIVEEVG